MAASINLLARPRASRRLLAALHRWIDLGNSAWAEERLSRVDFAWLAVAQMAEVIADVLLAGKRLVANEEAHVMALRICSALPHSATHVLASVLLAPFVLVAYLLAPEALVALQCRFRLDLLSQLGWVVLHVARHQALILAALALLLHLLCAGLASASVALLHALVEAAWEELVAGMVAQGNRICACSSLPPNQRLDGVVAAWAVLEALRVSWTRLAIALMAPSLALMLPAIQVGTTNVVAPLPLASASCCLLFLRAEAVERHLNGARLAGSLVALVLAFVSEAVQKLAALVLAGEL